MDSTARITYTAQHGRPAENQVVECDPDDLDTELEKLRVTVSSRLAVEITSKGSDTVVLWALVKAAGARAPAAQTQLQGTSDRFRATLMLEGVSCIVDQDAQGARLLIAQVSILAPNVAPDSSIATSMLAAHSLLRRIWRDAVALGK